MLNFEAAVNDENVISVLNEGLKNYVQRLIDETMDAYADIGRVRNPPIGTAFIWNPTDQSLLVRIGRLRREKRTYTEIADVLNQDGHTDRCGKPFTANQVRRYLNHGLSSEDTLQKIIFGNTEKSKKRVDKILDK